MNTFVIMALTSKYHLTTLHYLQFCALCPNTEKDETQHNPNDDIAIINKYLKINIFNSLHYIIHL